MGVNFFRHGSSSRVGDPRGVQFGAAEKGRVFEGCGGGRTWDVVVGETWLENHVHRNLHFLLDLKLLSFCLHYSKLPRTGPVWGPTKLLELLVLVPLKPVKVLVELENVRVMGA